MRGVGDSESNALAPDQTDSCEGCGRQPRTIVVVIADGPIMNEASTPPVAWLWRISGSEGGKP